MLLLKSTIQRVNGAADFRWECGLYIIIMTYPHANWSSQHHLGLGSHKDKSLILGRIVKLCMLVALFKKWNAKSTACHLQVIYDREVNTIKHKRKKDWLGRNSVLSMRPVLTLLLWKSDGANSGRLQCQSVSLWLHWIIRWPFIDCAHIVFKLIPEQPEIIFQHRGQLPAQPLPPDGIIASSYALFPPLSLCDPSPVTSALMINPHSVPLRV